MNARNDFNVNGRSFLFGISVTLLCLALVGGCKKEKLVQHGAGQRATIKEQIEQDRNLIGQVVQATEELEKHPDPAYLRNAVGRLDSWLQRQKESEFFTPDAEYQTLEKEFTELAQHFRKADQLFHQFRSKDAKPTEADGVQLTQEVDTITAKLGILMKKFPFNILKHLEKMMKDFSERLKGSQEFQFGDKTGMYRTVIEKFEIPEFLQFGLSAQRFETLAVLFRSGERSFNPEDADYLKQSVWFRNIAHWAKGEKQDDLTIAQNLFDWSVKNVALRTVPTTGPLGPIPQHPWQTVLLSQGNTLERTLVFIELLRQNRLDGFIVRPKKDPDKHFPLLVGVRIDKKIYLFVPELGLPIPGKEMPTLDKGLQFSSIATLDQVQKDDSLLRRLDLSKTESFPVTATQMKEVVALLPTNPFNMSERMRLMEGEFSSEVYTVLATSFTDQKKRLTELGVFSGVDHFWLGYTPLIEQLFFSMESDFLLGPYLFTMKDEVSIDPQYQSSESDRPTESGIGKSSEKKSPLRDVKVTIAPLWIGKILYIKGRFVLENGAAFWLQKGRTSERALKQSVHQLEEKVNQYLIQLQQESAQKGHALSPNELRQRGGLYMEQLQREIALKLFIKTTARYNLGLVSMAAGNNKTAITHLSDSALQDELNGMWRSSTLYLLARVNEVLEEYPRAIALNKTAAGPMAYGQKLRAKWLEELYQKNKKPSQEK